MTPVETHSQSFPATVRALATNAPVRGLTWSLCAWLYATHEELAGALHRAQSTAIGHEPMIAVDTLPENTRRYLWQSMQRHHPGLAQFVRDPVVIALRERFSASLHLHVADVLAVIVNAARASRQADTSGSREGRAEANSTRPKPSVRKPIRCAQKHSIIASPATARAE